MHLGEAFREPAQLATSDAAVVLAVEVRRVEHDDADAREVVVHGVGGPRGEVVRAKAVPARQARRGKVGGDELGPPDDPAFRIGGDRTG